LLYVAKKSKIFLDRFRIEGIVGIIDGEIPMPTTEKLIENVTETFEKETIERLLGEKQSESVSVSPSGTSTTVTNHSIDQTIKGLEYLRKTTPTNPFQQIGFGRAEMPTAID
jgi:hypothetical protein